MNRWKIVLAMFFAVGLVPSLFAQSPPYLPHVYYPGFGYYLGDGYYPGMSYYPVPASLSTNLPYRSNLDDQIDDLRRQIEAMQDQVQHLQTLLTALPVRQAQVAPTQEVSPARPGANEPVHMVFNDGRRVDVQGFVVKRDQMWLITQEGISKTPVISINLAETRAANPRRTLDFNVPLF